jgi:hypothetical protein
MLRNDFAVHDCSCPLSVQFTFLGRLLPVVLAGGDSTD